MSKTHKKTCFDNFKCPKNVCVKDPRLWAFFSLKISWDRARAERAILRVFGGIRAAGVGPKNILKIERRTAKKNLAKSAVKKVVGLRAMMRG